MTLRLSAVLSAYVVAAPLVYAQAPAWTEQPAQLTTPTGVVVGSLITPNGTARVPLVVMIAGSGPTDRNGNSVGAVKPNNLRQIAEALGERGIATLRYDKRGIAESRAAGPSEETLRFDMYADDAAAWTKQYRGDARFGPIVILGHSEGSLLGMLATLRAPADGFVSIAGVARRADKVLHDQLAASIPAPVLVQADSVMASLVAGKTVEDSPPMLASLFHATVQPYLISWFKYTGTDEIAKLRVPVLLIQGTSDIQVAPSEADALAKALPAAKLLVIQGMNHVCKITPAGRTEQMFSYTDSSVPLAPGLVDSIATFVKGVKQK